MNKKEEEFLNALAQYVLYWSKLPDDKLPISSFETLLESRLNGLVHSILVLLRGDSATNDFKIYDLKLGRTSIGGNEYLPSRYFEVFTKFKNDIEN